MIVVTGSVTARQDSFDEVRRLSLEHVHRSRTEPGCISHAVHVDCENPLRLVFFEQWADRAALLDAFCGPRLPRFRQIAAIAGGRRNHHRTVRRYQAGEIIDAWLYCHAKFILQCNIRAPRYLRIQCEAPMSEDWNTKYGTRRVRRDPPTLEEAIFAAVGITDDPAAAGGNRRGADGPAVRRSSG